MRQKGFILFPVIIIIVLTGFVGYLIYQKFQPINIKENSLSPTIIPATNLPISSPSPLPNDLENVLTILNNEVKPTSWVYSKKDGGVSVYMLTTPNGKEDINKYNLGELFTGRYEPLINNGWVTYDPKSGDAGGISCWAYVRKNTIKPSLQFCTASQGIELNIEE